MNDYGRLCIITFFSITVDTFAENDLRTYPLITFCPLMKDVIQLVDEETTFQDVLDQSPSRDLIISPKADEPMLVGKWTKTFKFFSHPKYGSRRLVQACFTYDHGQNVKVGSYEDHVSRGDLSPDNFRPRGTGNYGESKFSPGNPRGGQFT